MTTHHSHHSATDIDDILKALDEGKNKRVRKGLTHMHPAKVAAMIEAITPARRETLWQQVDAALEPRILMHLDIEIRRQLIHVSNDAQEPLPDSDVEHPAENEHSITQIEAVRTALADGKLKRVGKLLHRMHAAKVAGLLESLPPDERKIAWSMVETERAGKVLTFLHDEICITLASELDCDELSAAVQRLEMDDLVDLIQILPPILGQQVLQASDSQRRHQLESMLSYPEDSAGGLMNTDLIVVRADIKLNTVLRYLRLLEKLPPHTDTLMVVDRKNLFQGVLHLSRLVTALPEYRVAEIMATTPEAIPVNTSAAEVAQIFQEHELLSAAVIDENKQLLGRITVDDVMDRVRDDSERAVMQRAGLDEEADMFAPVLISARRRALWLGINLITAFLAAWVIGLFEQTLEKVVTLAVLMPIVASMGGIAGSQTLTLVIRGLALKQLQKGNTKELLSREIGVAILNGLLWSAVVALLTVAWFQSWQIGGIIAMAILLNLLCAALAGLAIPLLLDKLGIDPALAGSVVLTTITDVVGFLAFLGLATLFLL